MCVRIYIFNFKKQTNKQKKKKKKKHTKKAKEINKEKRISLQNRLKKMKIFLAPRISGNKIFFFLLLLFFLALIQIFHRSLTTALLYGRVIANY